MVCFGSDQKGEALATIVDQDQQHALTGSACIEPGHTPEGGPCWHVLWTRSNCEQLVHDQLYSKGYEILLPTVDKWSRRKQARCLYRAPLFPGYLFIRHAIDKASYLDICKSKGLVRILGERWDKLATVSDEEIEAVRRVNQSDEPRMPYPYLRVGQTVRILSGPLANVEGIFVQSKPKTGLLVLSIEMLRRSLAVEVDCALVTAA
ncbi:MAG: transcription termination/antitermination protein NusG [Bacillota bacterium]